MQARISLFLFFSVLVTSLALSSCKQGSTQGIIVIAVDDLSVDDVACTQDLLENQRSGWLQICRDSYRFTHAYTTSPMTLPALGSLMSGLYPFQHSLRHNSGQVLSPEIKTLAEEALDKKWKTAFFSGGLPVLRKSGLNQGFELFLDGLSVPNMEVYRPFEKNIELFKEWYSEEAEDRSFLSVFYVPDLSFPSRLSKTDFNEMRNQTAGSAIDELDENLFNLVQFLKIKNRWDQVTFVLVGLSGHSDVNERVGGLKGLNLHGENTQVAFFYKRAELKTQSKIGQFKSTTVDVDVNLADIGQTLIDQLTGHSTQALNEDWPIFSLTNLIESSAVDSHKQNLKKIPDRRLLIESGWPAWIGLSKGFSTAVVESHHLFLLSPQAQVYNLLTDRNEEHPVSLNVELKKKLELYKEKMILLGFVDEVWRSKDWRLRILEKSSAVDSDKARQNVILSEIKKIMTSETDPLFFDYAVSRAWLEEDWSTLSFLSQRNRNNFLTDLSGFYLKRKGARPDHVCFQLAGMRENSVLDVKKCEDFLFSKYLLDRVRSETKSKDFEKYFEIFRYRQKIKDEDLAKDIKFDADYFKNSGPQLFEIFLSFPENQKLKTQLFKKRKVNSDEI